MTKIRSWFPRTALCLLLAAVLTTAVPLPSRAGISLALSADARPSSASLSSLASSADSLVLELALPDVQVDQVVREGTPFTTLSIKGLEKAGTPGQPGLPFKSVLVGLPPKGGWSLHVTAGEPKVLHLSHPLEPSPHPEAPTLEPVAVPLPSPSRWATDAPTYAADVWLPSAPVEMGEPALMRDLRLARLVLNPIRYNPARGQVEYSQRLTVEIRFDEPQSVRWFPRDVWDPILEQAVVNYDVAQGWRGAQAAAPEMASSNPPASTPGSLKIEVGADGIYELTYDQLAGAGFPVAGDPDNLHLYTAGQEVATWVDSASASVIQSGDRIVFYGKAASGRYTGVNVYWLTREATSGLSMVLRDVTPQNIYTTVTTHWATPHFEGNEIYDPYFPEADGDRWYWTKLDHLQTLCPGETESYAFQVPELSASAHTATLRASLQGRNYADHDLSVSISGHDVAGSLSWSNLDRLEDDLTFPSTWLGTGANTLQLKATHCPPNPPANAMALNYFEVTYMATNTAVADALAFPGEAGNRQYELGGFGASDLLLFDVTDPSAPGRLTGAEKAGGNVSFEDETTDVRDYVALSEAVLGPPSAFYMDAPSNLASDANRADYLLIGHGPFLAAAEPLLTMRSAQGLSVMSIDVQDVHDEFSFGLLDPQAIRDFLAYAFANWQDLPDEPPPTYVLLLGDGTIDFKDYLGNGWHNYIPAYPVSVEPYIGETVYGEIASDNQLASVHGDDPLPDLLIGRLPVTSAGETATVVSKATGYESSVPVGSWNQRLMFVAEEGSGGDFPAASDGFVFGFPWSPLAPQRVYLTSPATAPHEYDPNVPAQVTAAQTAVQDGIHDGKLLVTYVGHSSTSQWAYKALLHRTDVPNLQNGGRLPVVLSMTCYTGAFQDYRYAVLEERLVLEPTGGAVATWGPIGTGFLDGHEYLAQGFYDAILDEADPATLGSATAAGRARLFTNGDEFFHYMIDVYGLLGDPALALNRESGSLPNKIFLPLIQRD